MKRPNRKGCRPVKAQQQPQRANPPGLYRCPCCGERLSGPARFYTCPRTDARGIRLPEVA